MKRLRHYPKHSDLRAEDNPIVGTTRASKGTSGVIFRVTISIRALTLKVPRIVSGLTTARITTILIRFKNGTRVVAPAVGPKHSRALSVYVGGASGSTGATRDGQEVHGHVEPVH
uniref:Uncharacterized protein n=1 Tax=Opuntia streptacantha TaxID=393608 RepID=A0A7C9D6U2_OPUST